LYLFDPSTWVDGTTSPHAADFQNIAADIHTAGGNRDGAGYGLPNNAFLTLVPGDLPGNSYPVTAASWAGGVATLTIGANNLQIGQHVSISGITPSGYNVADAVVTNTGGGGTQIMYALASNPGAWSSGGTVIVSGVSAAAGMLAIDHAGAIWTYYSGTWHQGIGTITSLGLIGSYNSMALAANGLATINGSTDLTGQTANIGSTNLVASAPANGLYILVVTITVDTAASTSSTLPAVSISYTDQSNNVMAGPVTVENNGNTLTTTVTALVPMSVKAGTAISFSTSGYASVGATHMAYSLRLRWIYLG
jgi:hypothetical protein